MKTTTAHTIISHTQASHSTYVIIILTSAYLVDIPNVLSAADKSWISIRPLPLRSSWLNNFPKRSSSANFCSCARMAGNNVHKRSTNHCHGVMTSFIPHLSGSSSKLFWYLCNVSNLSDEFEVFILSSVYIIYIWGNITLNIFFYCFFNIFNKWLTINHTHHWNCYKLQIVQLFLSKNKHNPR